MCRCKAEGGRRCLRHHVVPRTAEPIGHARNRFTRAVKDARANVKTAEAELDALVTALFAGAHPTDADVSSTSEMTAQSWFTHFGNAWRRFQKAATKLFKKALDEIQARYDALDDSLGREEMERARARVQAVQARYEAAFSARLAATWALVRLESGAWWDVENQIQKMRDDATQEWREVRKLQARIARDPKLQTKIEERVRRARCCEESAKTLASEHWDEAEALIRLDAAQAAMNDAASELERLRADAAEVTRSAQTP